MRRCPAARLTALLLAGTVLVSSFPASATIIDDRYKPYRAVSDVTGDLRIEGSPALRKYVLLWSEALMATYKGVRAASRFDGDAPAAAALTDGDIDIAAMSREMNSAEEGRFRDAHGYAPTEVRVGVDVLTVFVNKDNPLDCLPMSKLRDAFSAPSVTWGDLGATGNWAAKPVLRLGYRPGSSEAGFFAAKVMDGQSFASDMKTFDKSSEVVDRIGKDEGAIGYAPVGYRTGREKSLRLSTDDGKCILANQMNAYRRDFPITRFLYMYVDKAPDTPLSPPVREFFTYAFSLDGQKDAALAGYYPLPYVYSGQEIERLGLKRLD
ncbi:substrate-binding domain-containing protein [Parvibaculum sp.]|uniref:PstS family phosphate ABC transporter substrate-binding protein n=1 Tax=Parvibaculum sp. TaxID=2024848 RepID=UPI000C8E893D|nr:substrate-binding domain-containing protein [Parvibaculum sp.]MAB15253.1 hypothetical protein [Parvibaculum sp.]